MLETKEFSQFLPAIGSKIFAVDNCGKVFWAETSDLEPTWHEMKAANDNAPKKTD